VLVVYSQLLQDFVSRRASSGGVLHFGGDAGCVKLMMPETTTPVTIGGVNFPRSMRESDRCAAAALRRAGPLHQRRAMLIAFTALVARSTR
jgi:hypothetical protein